MTAPGRIPCVIPFCRCTAPKERYPDGTEIICSKCYRLASKHDRRRLRRVHRIMTREGVTGFRDSKPGSVGRHAVVLQNRLWERIVKQATEAKVGIG